MGGGEGGRGGLKHVRLEMLWCLTPPLLLSQAFTCKFCSPDQIEENRSRSTPVPPRPPFLLRPPPPFLPPPHYSAPSPLLPMSPSSLCRSLHSPPTDSAPLRPTPPSTPPFSAPITPSALHPSFLRPHHPPPPPPTTFVPLHPILPPHCKIG